MSKFLPEREFRCWTRSPSWIFWSSSAHSLALAKKDLRYLIAFCMRRESKRDRSLIWMSKYFFDTKELPESNLYRDRLMRQPSHCRHQSSCQKESFGAEHAIRAGFSGLQVLTPLLRQKMTSYSLLLSIWESIIDNLFCRENTFFYTKELPESNLYWDRIRRQPSRCRCQIIARKRVLVQDTLSELDFLVFKCSLYCSVKNNFIFLIAFCVSKHNR